jgi:hypothetical protein
VKHNTNLGNTTSFVFKLSSAGFYIDNGKHSFLCNI